MKLYQNGTSAYMGGVGTHKRAKRGLVTGWSAASARRQTRWLWTVDAPSLSGYGYAVTLTLKDTPETAAEFHALRRAWVKRLERMGAIRVHWVIEWQARGTPHLHGAIYFDRKLNPQERLLLVGHWVMVSQAFSPSLWAQDVEDIRGSMGWLKYLSKHASRGVNHYQRSGHPESWDRTGRLWGASGAWPVIEPLVIDELSNWEFYRVRRLMRAWAYADARKAGDVRRMKFLRQSISSTDERKSRFQGSAEWIPESVAVRLVEFLREEQR